MSKISIFKSKVNVSVKNISPLQEKSDCLILPLFDDSRGKSKISFPLHDKLDRKLKGAISQLQKEMEVTGRWKEVTLLHTRGRIPANRVMVVGLGKEKEFTLDHLRRISGVAVKKANEIGLKRVTMALPRYQLPIIKNQLSDVVQAVTEGISLGLYTFDKYQSRTTNHSPDNLRSWVLTEDVYPNHEIKKGIEVGSILAGAQNFARDLVNEPSNAMTPTVLADRAKEIGKESGLKMEIIEGARLKKLGMGGLSGVAQGSNEPPNLIILRYEGDPKKKNWTALVGKGITFDSGGISIKPSQGMGAMKGDMGGGAAVIAAMGAIGKLKPNINVVGIVPATENMPSGHAYKPGDVLTMKNGKTVEIISTDAEGRLVLADALVYAKEIGASRLVNIATLTGGCVVAFGKTTSAVMGNDEEMIQSIIHASEKTGEKMWQLPLFEEYDGLLKSDVADLKNSSGTREASTICGGIFLKAFAPDKGWVHIDIAGKEMMDREGEIHTTGGSGVGVRTLVQFVMDSVKKS
jgi:leucyl aminopeptidase